ncbi:DoxX family membrane protein [Candidatus Pacearchaeota archaeon]|nr:DoxX family membrane protein [Candidatus Pacearchaeota archaeon]
MKIINALPRISVGCVFFIFGIMQLINPEKWIGYLPTIISSFGDPLRFIFFNGIFDLFLGFFLLLGLFTRIVSFIGIIHLIGVILTFGFNDISVRDFGLLLVLVSVFLRGPDDYCLDNKFWKKRI